MGIISEKGLRSVDMELISKLSSDVVDVALSEGNAARILAESVRGNRFSVDRARRLKEYLVKGVNLCLENELANDEGGEIDVAVLSERAKSIVDDFLSNGCLFESFCYFFPSLRWSTDKNRFVADLCINVAGVDDSDHERFDGPIPLAAVPIVEALIADEVKLYGPRAKYDIGPEEFTGEIWRSDSDKAQAALVDSVCTRLPVGERNIFDGPREFQYKGGVVGSLCGAYRNPKLDQKSHDRLLAHIITILDAYTFEGSIAASVREEDRIAKMGRTLAYDCIEVEDVKKIVAQILANLLVDSNVYGREVAENVMNKYVMARRLVMPIDDGGEGEASLVDRDALAFDKAEQMIVHVNALYGVREGTDVGVFERMGKLVFTPEAAIRLRELAEEKVQLLQSFAGSSGGNSEELEVLNGNYERHISMFLIRELEAMLKDGGGKAFEDFVGKISLSSHGDITSDEYKMLVALGKNEGLNSLDKYRVISGIVQCVKYQYCKRIERADQLKRVILDVLEICLGPSTLTTEEFAEHLKKGISHGSIDLELALSHAESMKKIDDPEFWSIIEGYMSKIEEVGRNVDSKDAYWGERLSRVNEMLGNLLKTRSS